MTRFALLAGVVLMLVSSVAAACGFGDVCNDTTASLSGWIISAGLRPGVELVRLEWTTDGEKPGAVAAYALRRCDSSTCQPIAYVMPVGSCGTDQAYEYTDQPPPPVRRWSYRLDVIRVDGVVACSVRTVPR